MTTPDDHLVVLFGALATSRSASCCRGCSVSPKPGCCPCATGSSARALEDLDDNAFRELARDAVDEFGGGSADPRPGERFARNLLYADARDRTP